MKKTTIILLSAVTFAFVGCSDSKVEDKSNTIKVIPVKAVSAPKQTSYTLEEIYNSMCIQCHSSDGSGNTEKLTPSMRGQSVAEMKKSLIEVENDKGHIIMEHNRGEILKKGMNYSAEGMANYMHNRFDK